MKRILYALLCWVCMSVCFSCSDTDPEIQNPAGEVTETEDGTLSSFYVDNTTGSSYNEQTPVEFELVDPVNQTIYTYSGTMQSVRDQLVNGTDNVLHCAMLLGESNIPDGYYYITILVDGEVKSSGHYVNITENVITPVRGAQYSYSGLEGDGTSENPYKIKSNDDFEYFLKTLKEDPDRGYGRFFELTADVTAPSFKDKPQLAGAEFQGTFDGRNHTISGLRIQGIGMGQNERAGMFSIIFNATVKDVAFADAILAGVHSYGGTVAGYAKGKNTITGVKVTGEIEGESYIGGLIGAAEGQLTVRDCEIDAIVKATIYAGGVVGALTADSNTSDFNNLDVRGQVLKATDAGGVIGMLAGSKAPTLGSIKCYSYIKGSDNVGGFIGFVNKNTPVISADCSYEGVREANFNIYGEENVGGFVGFLDMNGSQSFKIDNHTVYLDVAVRGAKGNVGGLVGYATKGWIKVNKLNISKADNRVESSGDCVGGVAGWLDGVCITGPVRISDKHELPKASSLASMYNGTVFGKSRVGGCIGYLDRQEFGDPHMERGYITGLACKAQVTATGNVVGGVVGEVFGDVNNCAFSGTVSGPNIVGGVVGKAQYAMTQELCVNYANIDGGTYQGGVCGYSNPVKDPFGYDTTIGHSSCYNIGRLTNGKTVGGIVGYAGQQNGCNFYLYGCENYGEIVASGSGDYSVGGIAGDVDNNDTKVEWCYNYADVSSKTVQFVIGGVVGRLGREQITQNYLHVVGCLNMGTITCDKTSTKLGGVIGHMMYGGEGMIAGCVNWGDIPCDQKDDTGGILGCATSFNYIARNWNRGNIAHGNAIIGTHKAGTTFDHLGNYYLEGTGGSWPSSVAVAAEDVTKKSSYPDLPFTDNPGYFNWMGEHFYMSSNGPIPFYFNFVHWNVDKLKPEGWKIY